MELYPAMDDEHLRAYRSWIIGQTDMGDIVAGVCYSSPDQDEICETLFIQLKKPHIYRHLVLT